MFAYVSTQCISLTPGWVKPSTSSLHLSQVRMGIYSQLFPLQQNKEKKVMSTAPEAGRTSDLEIILPGYCNLSLLPL